MRGLGHTARIAVRIATTTIIAVAAVAIGALPAHAEPLSTVVLIGSDLHFTAAAGTANLILLGVRPEEPNAYSINDQGGTRIIWPAATPCRYDSATSVATVVCTVPGLDLIHVSTLDDIDTIWNFTDRATRISTGDGDDGVYLGGRAGAVTAVNTGAGNDWITPGPGNDAINGSTGTDVVHFQSAIAVTASLATGLASQGGDSDTLTGIENLTGGGGADVLTGNGSANILRGGTGGPCDPFGTCARTSGADRLYGGGGEDTLYGGAEADDLFGGDGADTIYGEAGADFVSGEGGWDTLFGGDDNDKLSGGSAFDYGNGEAGADVCSVEARINCEG